MSRDVPSGAGRRCVLLACAVVVSLLGSVAQAGAAPGRRERRVRRRPAAAPTAAPARAAPPYDVGSIYRLDAASEPLPSEPGAGVFALEDWNLLPQRDEPLTVPPAWTLAGWRLGDEAPVTGSAAREQLFRPRSDLTGAGLQLRTEGEFAGSGVLDGAGRSGYQYYGAVDREDRLLVGSLRREFPGATTVSARVMMASARLGSEGGLGMDADRLPAGAAQVGVEKRLGRMRVFGEFQINDWNGLGDAPRADGIHSSAPFRPAAAPGATGTVALLSDGSALSSPLDPSFDRGLKETVSLQLGAALPTERSVGAVRYRVSSDGAPGSATLGRQQVGVQGELEVQQDVRLKAGYEWSFSEDGRLDHQEQSVWTGIDIHF